MKNSIFPRVDCLRYLRRIHISYHPGRPRTEIAKQLIMRVTAEATKKKFPHLQASWEMLAYDAPATIEVEFMDGRRMRRIIDGYTKAERKAIVDKWRFTASMEPWPEVLAPEPLQSSRQSTSNSSSSSSEGGGESEESEKKKNKAEEAKK